MKNKKERQMPLLFIVPEVLYIYKPSFCLNRRPSPILKHSVFQIYKLDNGEETRLGYHLYMF